MTIVPSFYLDELARQKQRSQELGGNINAGIGESIGGLDRLGQLQKYIEERDYARGQTSKEEALAAEAKAHGRETEAENNDRARQRFEWEKADRAKKLADGNTTPAMAKLNEALNAQNIKDTVTEGRTLGASPEFLSTGLNGKPDPDALAIKAEFTRQGTAADKTTRDAAAKDAKTREEEAKINAENELAALRNRSKRPGPPKDPNAPKSAKEEGIELRNKLTKARLDNMPGGEHGRVPGGPELQKLSVMKSGVQELTDLIKDAETQEMGLIGGAIKRGPDGLAKDPNRRRFESRLDMIATDLAPAYRNGVTDLELKSLHDALMKASDSRGGFIAVGKDKINDLMRRMQNETEMFSSVGYAMPKTGDAASASGRVTVTNGHETLSIPRTRLAEAQADGFHETGP